MEMYLKLSESGFYHITGSVRDYLESASEYMNPMLEEMYKAEKLFE